LRNQEAPAENGMVRCDSGKDGSATRAGASADEKRHVEVSPETGGSVSSCGGTVCDMSEVNYAK
jgi:hypothetical protein